MPAIKQHFYCLVLILFRANPLLYVKRRQNTYRGPLPGKQIDTRSDTRSYARGGDERSAVVLSGAPLLQANTPRACFTTHLKMQWPLY